jgi:hypothetical protein
VNPNEKDSTKHESRVTDHSSDVNASASEPAWLRDNQIVKVEFDESLNASGVDWIAKICEGEKQHCEHCGAGFPLWPPQRWANHVLGHSADLTRQAIRGMIEMSAPEPNDLKITFFAMTFAQRVSMRRRAWQLGYAKPEEGKPRLVS